MKTELENNLQTQIKNQTSLWSKEFVDEEAKYELSKIVEIVNRLNENDLNYNMDNKKRG